MPSVRLLAAMSICLVLPAAAARADVEGRSATEKPARLGVYYFGGWSGTFSNFEFNGLLSGPYAGREPLYGWLDKSTATMRTQLYWARRMGADFFNFLWYYRPEAADPFLNTALGNYLALKDHQGVRFAITYTNEERFVIPRDRWRQIAEMWVTKYFLDPDYVRIGGKPVLFVLEGNSFFEQWGGNAGAGAAQGDSNVSAALEELRSVARARGLPGVFVVGGRYTPHNFDYQYFPEPFRGQSWDAVSQYGYPALTGVPDGERPYAELARAAREMWDRFGGRTVQPYIPVVTVGWDPRPWQEKIEDHLFWFRRSPAEVGQLVADAVAWAGRNPSMRVDQGAPLVMLATWNELGEGMYVVPTKVDGFSYARAIAAALGQSWNPTARALTVKVNGRGTVSVSGKACAATCTRSFVEGTVATLRARPARGFRFAGWGGSCRGRIVSCSLLLASARTVSARFAPR